MLNPAAPIRVIGERRMIVEVLAAIDRGLLDVGDGRVNLTYCISFVGGPRRI